jgi:hypothetical protein
LEKIDTEENENYINDINGNENKWEFVNIL